MLKNTIYWYKMVTDKCIGGKRMQRTIYAYDIDITPQRGKNVKVLNDYRNDLVEMIRRINRYNKRDKTYKIEKEKKILYLDHVNYDAQAQIIKLKFISARYGIVRNVMNTVTLVNRGKLKEKPDGDLEKTHIIIKLEDNNKAVALYEYNKDGIGFKKVLDYLNAHIKLYHTKKEDMILYKLIGANIISQDFLSSLEKMRRIKAVTLTVDQEDIGVSDTKYFAGRNDLSTDVEILLKPAAKGASILGTTVKDFYKIYNSPDMPIKRITVSGDRDTKDPLTFDTEKMKAKYPIDVLEESTTGEVDTSDIFNEMKKLFQYY